MDEFSDRQVERYARHLVLPEIGEEGQAKLLRSSVLVLGAGGLGAPLVMYLAAAGIGRLGVVDDDEVDLSNLQRQVIHREADVGRPKVESARDFVARLDPAIRVEPHHLRFTAANALELVGAYDLVVDGSDNFATRYLANGACHLAGRTLVTAAIMRFDGQLSVFRSHRHDGTPCYRCLFGDQGEDPKESCADVGVLGALAGVMGSLAAVETVKELLGIGRTMAGRLLLYDALSTELRVLKTKADPACPLCGPQPTIRTLAAERYRPVVCAAE
jgi:adenylyltransferase/sulfurtransferase